MGWLGAILLLISGIGIYTMDRRPSHGLVEQAYFLCYKCGNAEGGIYGKGPFRKFGGSKPWKCLHKWKRVNREEFKAFVTAHFGIDWAKEIPFWSQI